MERNLWNITRILGAKMLEFYEVSGEELRATLGNCWQKIVYSQALLQEFMMAKLCSLKALVDST